MVSGEFMRTFHWISFFSIFLLATLHSIASSAQPKPTGAAPPSHIDPDPLRRFLPPADLFMPVPGGLSGVGDPSAEPGTIEEQKSRRDGGLLVGYCFKFGCSHVTHLAVLQVCDNYIGGKNGKNELVLGVVKLPYQNMPGYLKALQGRDYALNYFRNGPVEEVLTESFIQDGSSNYMALVEGRGPVQPLEYYGLMRKKTQSPNTISLRVEIMENKISGIRFPRFEIRHLCDREFS
jgi:hypothetical protein